VFSPRWLALHALAIALVAVCLVLGAWQWNRGEAGNTRSFAYAVQWPLFAAFVVFMWLRILRDGLRPPTGRGPDAGPAEGERVPGVAAPPPPPVKHRRGADHRPAPEEDPELAAYNRYLRDLAIRQGPDGR
jgi:hypothetical protein